MIAITKPDGWIVFYENDGETEIGRVKMPERFTMAELDKFIDQLRREVRMKEHGPS